MHISLAELPNLLHVDVDSTPNEIAQDNEWSVPVNIFDSEDLYCDVPLYTQVKNAIDEW